MKQFQYKAIEIDDARPKMLEPILNVHGKDGWKVIYISGMTILLLRELDKPL